MDDITKKRINECVKRALTLNSGRELKYPLTFCFSNNIDYENKCTGNINPEKTPDENHSRRCYQLSSECFGCAFYKNYFFVSDSLRALKTYISLTFQKNEITGFENENARRKFYSLALTFLKNLLDLTREKCYLTFSNSMVIDAKNALDEMSPSSVYNLVIKIYDFCKENNIK